MRIDNNLRNLIMRQPETVMLSRTRCDYFGYIYTFMGVTDDEIDAQIMALLRIVNKKSWAAAVLDRLRKG